MAVSSMENPQDPEGAKHFGSVLIVDKGFDDVDENDCQHLMDSTNSSLSSKSDVFSSFATPMPLPLHLDDSHLVVVSSASLLQDTFYNEQQHTHLEQAEEDYNDGRDGSNGKHESYSSYYPLKRKPSRTLLYLRNRVHASNMTIVAVCFSILLSVLLVHRLFSLYMTHRQWINAPITYMTRPCDAPAYETISSSLSSRSSLALLDDDANNNNNHEKVNICITTLTDSKSTFNFQRFIRWRNFDGILELTWQNKLDYARKHGYHLIDASAASLDTSRPPAWSKIPAVQRLLQPPLLDSTSTSSSTSSTLPHCDWVMWTDADTVFMNSQRQIQDFLPTATATQDLLVGSDNGGGYNSGVFLLRNTDWSRQFLQDWWNMVNFIRPPGLSLSGDNAALKALLAAMPPSYFQHHVLVPSRCTLNSFAKFLTISESRTVMEEHGNLQQQSWFMSQDYYHKGDFLAHAPGYDNKAECLRLLLQEAR